MLCCVCIPYLYHVPLFCTFVACQSGSTPDMFTYFACLLKSANISQVSAKRSHGKQEDANKQKVHMYVHTKYTHTDKHVYTYIHICIMRIFLCLNYLHHFLVGFVILGLMPLNSLSRHTLRRKSHKIEIFRFPVRPLKSLGFINWQTRYTNR